MDIFKIIGVGIIGAVISVFLKESKPEFVIFAVMTAGVTILIIVLNSLTDVIDAFNVIVNKTNIDESLFSGILKIIGIGYIAEYSAEICGDMNCASIAGKIQLAGKITIFLMALPIMTAFIDVISALGAI
ncbi:MAG: stage III sporulation protein AD [Clostridiales bacterium]|jgi:stage III sporulation protein AD|nr:stage III sporulation protein AD [Clostridiales bacterium]